MQGLRIDDAWWPRPPRPGVPHRHSVGVRGVDPAAWLRPRPGDAELLAWKTARLDEAGPAAFAALPGTGPAGAAVLALLGGGDAGGRHPLDAAARRVVEDLCLVDLAGPAPVLVAGSVAMPNRWRLADKLGRDMLGVHAPVPGYAEQIGPATDQLMHRLAGDRIMARTNWSIGDDPALFQPADSSRVAVPRPDVRTPADAARLLLVRVEYQTVRALAVSGQVLFTIRTAQQPVGSLAGRPDVAALLLAVLRSMDDEQLDYKGVLPYAGPLLAWLEATATTR